MRKIKFTYIYFKLKFLLVKILFIFKLAYFDLLFFCNLENIDFIFILIFKVIFCSKDIQSIIS